MKSRKKICAKLYSQSNLTLFRDPKLNNVNVLPLASQKKVIVLDCDNTLWKGACGEVGPEGIELSQEFIALQQFMIKKHKQGVLLCLCSKNIEEDVLAVFRNSKKMIIKKEHITVYKINWQKKSINIRLIAQELQQDLKNFIFIDDNEVECQDVMTELPEVLTLQLPKEQNAILKFLKKIDISLSGSLEDQKPAIVYQTNLAPKTKTTEVPKQTLPGDKESKSSISFRALEYSILNDYKEWLDQNNNVSIHRKKFDLPLISYDFKHSDFDLDDIPWDPWKRSDPNPSHQLDVISQTMVCPLINLWLEGNRASHECELYSCYTHKNFSRDVKKVQEMLDVECAMLRRNIDETYLKDRGVSEYHIMKIFNKFYCYDDEYFKHYECRNDDTRFISHFCRILINLTKLNIMSNRSIELIIESGN